MLGIPPNHWLSEFSDREQKEIVYDMLYAQHFQHGTAGHLERMVIARMASMLNEKYHVWIDAEELLSQQPQG